jgi:hypothetical protein
VVAPDAVTAVTTAWALPLRSTNKLSLGSP